MNWQVEAEEEDGDFAVGFMWGVVFSAPLWISFLGWVKIFSQISI